MDSDGAPARLDRAALLADEILAKVEQLDPRELVALLRREFRAVAVAERQRCADEIGSHNTYQGRGSHFAAIIRRGHPHV